VVNSLAEDPEPDEDNRLSENLLPEQVRTDNVLHSAPPAKIVVLFHPVPAQVRHLNWWLTNCFVDHVDIFHIYVEMGNDECAQMPLKF